MVDGAGGRDRVALLADGHLTGDDGARLDTLVAALDALGDTCAAVYVLGDLFEVWLGVATPEPHVTRLGAALARLRARGVRTAYVEGNRDFAIGRGATAGLFDAVAGEELVERFGGVTLALSHGDLVNTRDRPYRAWRRLSKRLLAPAALALLPDRTTLALARRLEERLRRTNRRHKSYFPEERLREHAARRIAAGADVVCVGHFHRELVAEVAAGGRRGTLVSLPFWHEEPRAMLVGRDGRVSRAELGAGAAGG